ncbi:MAG: DUF6882 domain-containing protein [Pseudomonadota bacterium]
MKFWNPFRKNQNQQDTRPADDTGTVRLSLSEDPLYRSRLQKCALQHRASTFSCIRSWGLGQERGWQADQNTGQLALKFSDGAQAHTNFECIGSFTPHEKTFLLACDNSSIPADRSATSAAMRAYGKEAGIPELTTPHVNLAFEDLTQIVCLANEFADLSGIVRGMDDDHRSIFLGVGPFSFANAEGREISSKAFWNRAEVSDPDPQTCLQIVKDYFVALDPIEKDWIKAGDNRDLNAAIARKQIVYDAFWTRDDDYWHPCSMGDHYDPENVSDWVSFPKRGGGTFVLPYNPGSLSNTPYLVETFAKRPRITDHDVDWGWNCLWT